MHADSDNPAAARADSAPPGDASLLPRGTGTWTRFLLLALALMACTATIEYLMGRTPISKSGTIRLWVSETNGAETSQQLFDWYSFTHMTHGFLFYLGLWLIFRRRVPVMACLAMAVFVEGSWEILENSDFIINRYREATLANGYFGDSILNSMMDIVCCTTGFLLAWRLPAWASVLIVVGTEVALAVLIRDNLALNVLMLIYPIEAIKRWQMGGG